MMENLSLQETLNTNSTPGNNDTSEEAEATVMIRAALNSQEKREGTMNEGKTNEYCLRRDNKIDDSDNLQKEGRLDEPIYAIPTITCGFCELVCKDVDDLQLHQALSCPQIKHVDDQHYDDPHDVQNNTSAEKSAQSSTLSGHSRTAKDLSQDAITNTDELQENPCSTEEQTVTETVTESTKILARFCVDAPTVEVRNCIRHYKENYSYKQQTNAFNTFGKQIIIDTLLFLGGNHKEWKDHLKSLCVRELIYRIQCLLPEQCGICKESYTISKSDPCLLSCRVCHQEVHKECYFPLLKSAANAPISDALLKITGFHFLCPSCENNLIPDQDEGLKKAMQSDSSPQGAPPAGNACQSAASKNPKSASGLTSQNTTHVQDHNPPDKIEPISQSKLKENPPPPILPNIVVKGTQQKQEENQKSQPKKAEESGNDTAAQTCKHYRNNQCKHGISGKGCKYTHPKRCTKLMKHGTRANKGCNLGTKCSDFHPKMCPMSITKLECLDDSCQLSHVKGTRRKPLSSKKPSSTKEDVKKGAATEENPSSVNQITSEIDPMQQSFLVQINLLKKELQEAMEKKVNALLHPQQATAPIQPLQTQHQMFPFQMLYPQMLYPQAPIPWVQQLQRMQPFPQIPMMGY